MSEREEVSRFDFEHPPCKGYGCCGGGGMEKYEDGEYVRYDDYAALRSQLSAAESIAQAREVLIAALRADKDEARAQLTTAERERAEARRELAVLRDTVLVERQAIEQLRHRAERAERVVGAARRMRDGGPRYEEALYDAVDALDAAEGK